MSQNATTCWTDIPVADLDRAMTFYAAVLGEAVTKQGEGDFTFGLLPHAKDQVSDCLVKVDDNRPSQQGPLVYLSVDGRIDQAIEAVAANGGEVLLGKQPIGPYGFRAVLLDSEGNRVALHSKTA